jgi:hypothetical protein
MRMQQSRCSQSPCFRRPDMVFVPLMSPETERA